MAERFESQGELIEKVIKVNRVAKVVKGGRRFSFSAIVVVGDGKSMVGYGLGKANEVTEAIRKGNDHARKHMKRVTMEGSTIPHKVVGNFGSSKTIMNPSAPGSGVIAAGAVRAVMECAGIHDISVKSLGSTNPHNLIKAAINGLEQLKGFDEIARRRGVPVEKLREAGTRS